MSDAVIRLARALEGTVALLRENGLSTADPGTAAGAGTHATLLEQCVAMCAASDSARVEPLRTIHHFACTGGTFISACLSSMPNVQLLGELDPLSPLPPPGNRPRFSPTDMINHLRQSTRAVDPDLYIEVFRAEVRVVHAACTRRGQRLVLRDHAHSHYCTGSEIPTRPSLGALLPPEVPQLAALTVRDPRDSFASAALNRWLHFKPDSFDEYCRRYLRFIDDHADVPRLRYEDFAAEPIPWMKQLCRWLDIPFDPQFPDVFAAIRLTGNSGRAASRIERRERRQEAQALDADASPAYRELARRLGYA